MPKSQSLGHRLQLFNYVWEKQAYCLKIPYPVNGNVEDTTFMNIS